MGKVVCSRRQGNGTRRTTCSTMASGEPVKTIEDLDLPVRAFNLLKREGINQVDAVTMMRETDLFDVRGMGQKDVNAIKEALEREGLRLRPAPVEAFTDVIDVEHVTVYRWGLSLQVTVNGDGSAVLSTRELGASEMQALCSICAQITQERETNDH